MKAFVRPGAKFATITADNKKTKPWRQEIAGCAFEAMQKQRLAVWDGPVAIGLRFYFAKPKSTKKSITQKTTKPDLDKLVRSVLDGLTGVAFVDDSQVVRFNHCEKGFDSTPRAEIEVDFVTQEGWATYSGRRA